MTIGFVCVLIAVLLPQIWAGVAKKGLIQSKQYDNSAPRLQFETLSGSAQRAHWAEKNAYEALPGFIAAVFIAHLAGAEQSTIAILAIIHVVSRFAYGLCYIKDYASARSAVWAVATLCTLGLFIAAF